MKRIKVGDTIRLIKDISDETIKELNDDGVIFPLKVESIDNCPHRASRTPECSSCSGGINKNNLCFGYEGKYIVEVIPQDWDE